MSSVFYVNVEHDTEKCIKKAPSRNKTRSDELKNSDSLIELTTLETCYNSERDIAYTPMEKTSDGNIAIHEVKSVENVSVVDNLVGSVKKELQTDSSLNYISLDFNETTTLRGCDQSAGSNMFNSAKSSPKSSRNNLPGTQSDETLYACIDFDKTSALKEISRTKT